MSACCPRYSVAFGSACAAVFISAVLAATPPVPDFSGVWARPYVGFEPPISGPGPVLNRSRVNGQSNLNAFVGDYTNPILKPNAADAIKRHGQIEIAGATAPNPSNQCRPMSPPYILQRQQMQFVQQEHQITILYAEDEQVRRVRLNARHPEHVIPSWHGDSIGHFEGDTLIVDTVGIKAGPYSMIDSFGTPYSEAMHLVERYRLIDYQEGLAAAARSERENRVLRADSFTGNGVAVDTGYRGKALQVQFTVEDERFFTMPWSAVTTYWRGSGDWVERVCSDNVNEYYAGQLIGIPRANAPDF